MKVSRILAPAFYLLAAGMIAYSVWQGLWVVPPEAVQKDSARILFIHVPSAWLAMSSYVGMAAASLIWFVWRHELADIAAKSIAPVDPVQARFSRHVHDPVSSYPAATIRSPGSDPSAPV